jgi:hypothetical protein
VHRTDPAIESAGRLVVRLRLLACHDRLVVAMIDGLADLGAVADLVRESPATPRELGIPRRTLADCVVEAGRMTAR